MKLRNFLVEAKKNTYASQGEGGEIKLNDGSKELVYEDGNLRYRDRYFGSKFFSGEEVVFENNVAIWSMNYYGKQISNIVSGNELAEFLKKALRLVDEELPFRGPLNFKEDDFEYVNNVNGNLEFFNGEEKILFKGEEVYFLVYHGGFVNK